MKFHIDIFDFFNEDYSDNDSSSFFDTDSLSDDN